jgi:hypothetical protein
MDIPQFPCKVIDFLRENQEIGTFFFISIRKRLRGGDVYENFLNTVLATTIAH